MTQMNLGNALSGLGERESRTARPEEALTCILGAIEVYQQAGASYWMGTGRPSPGSINTVDRVLFRSAATRA
jgi:hypothetical protein